MRHPAALASLVAAVLFAAGAAGPGRAQEAAAPGNATLAGNTLSAVLFLPHEAAGGGSLDRVVFQAFLRPDGTALIRRWMPARNAYTTPGEQRWSLADNNTLCLDFPANAGVPRICVEIHVWGPRIAGNATGAGRFALLDGDIEPGNAILAAR